MIHRPFQSAGSRTPIVQRAGALQADARPSSSQTLTFQKTCSAERRRRPPYGTWSCSSDATRPLFQTSPWSASKRSPDADTRICRAV